jgi:hypothetical protein
VDRGKIVHCGAAVQPVTNQFIQEAVARCMEGPRLAQRAHLVLDQLIEPDATHTFSERWLGDFTGCTCSKRERSAPTKKSILHRALHSSYTTGDIGGPTTAPQGRARFQMAAARSADC